MLSILRQSGKYEYESKSKERIVQIVNDNEGGKKENKTSVCSKKGRCHKSCNK